MLILVPLMAGVYGILHDQITYSISPEYFTHFKFVQFRIAEGLRDYERLAAAVVGFLSTWWVGILLAIPLGIIGYQKLDAEQYRKSKIRSVKIIFSVAILFGVIGYLVGLYYVSSTADWPVNAGNFERIGVFDLEGWDNFMIVGVIHKFSYLGALLGLLFALVNQFRQVKRLSKKD